MFFLSPCSRFFFGPMQWQVQLLVKMIFNWITEHNYKLIEWLADGYSVMDIVFLQT